MLRRNSRAVCAASAIVFRRGQEGVAVLWLLIGAAALVAALIIIGLQMAAAPGPVTFTVYEGSVTAPQSFPAIIDNDVSVTYMVTTKNITVPYGAGPGFPPTAKTTPVAVKDAVVVFSLANGDATFSDGTTSKNVTTDANGAASVTIKPAQDGDDTLSFVMKITTGRWWNKKTHTIPDTSSIQFEVEVP